MQLWLLQLWLQLWMLPLLRWLLLPLLRWLQAKGGRSMAADHPIGRLLATGTTRHQCRRCARLAVLTSTAAATTAATVVCIPHEYGLRPLPPQIA